MPIDNSPKDTSWIRSSFLRLSPLQQSDAIRFQKSNGWFKYTDTTLGGNWAINAPYQFTRYADLKEPRLLSNVGRGMGRYYSQHIDDYGHNVHFRLGVPAYNGLLNYLMSAIDGYSARYVATGRSPGFFDAIGTIAGWIISAMFWEVTALTMLLKLYNSLTGTRFYYLKPTMFQYWKTVQTILNSISANLGLTVDATKTDNEGNAGADFKGIGWGEKNPHERLLPHMANPTSAMMDNTQDIGIDIHAVASRANALQFRHQEYMKKWMQEKAQFNGNIRDFMHDMERHILEDQNWNESFTSW